MIGASRIGVGALGLAVLMLVAGWTGTAAATSFQISNLRVAGGDVSWHSNGDFTLEWDHSPPPPALPRAVLYRLYDGTGSLVQATGRVAGATNKLLVKTPAEPGVYSAELWLEDAEGKMGPPSRATLRFDDAVPPAPAPQAPLGWLAARQVTVLDIEHPPPPLPVSGIRGYAISVDTGGGSAPCALAGLCLLGETDLPGGIDDDTISLGTLPEGTSFARVVAVSGSGVASAVASVPIRVDGTPPQLSLRGAPESGWSSGPLQLTAVAEDRLSGMAATGPSGPFTAIAVDGSTPRIEPDGRVSTWARGTGAHRVTYFARDAAGNVNDGQLGSADPLTSIVRIDEEPPRVAFAATQDRAEPERIEALVSDADSGPSPDRGAILLRPVGGGRFRELPTQVSGGRLVARWDSEAFPPGRYEFLASGFDRAGNTASSGYRRNGLKMILANPLKTPVKLEAGFAGMPAGARGRIVAAGRSVVFAGRLRTAGGGLPAGLPVTVTEAFAGGSSPSSRSTILRTAEDGSFSLRLPPGPSRDISVTFAGTRTLTRAAFASVHLSVRAAVRLRVSARSARIGGAPVVFSGRVAGAGASSRNGVPIELQFRYGDAEWSEFRTVETDARGRFRYPYRFSDDDSRGVRFRFRARAGQKEGWPYEPAFSNPVAVSGR